MACGHGREGGREALTALSLTRSFRLRAEGDSRPRTISFRATSPVKPAWGREVALLAIRRRMASASPLLLLVSMKKGLVSSSGW